MNLVILNGSDWSIAVIWTARCIAFNCGEEGGGTLDSVNTFEYHVTESES